MDPSRFRESAFPWVSPRSEAVAGDIVCLKSCHHFPAVEACPTYGGGRQFPNPGVPEIVNRRCSSVDSDLEISACAGRSTPSEAAEADPRTKNGFREPAGSGGHLGRSENHNS